MAEWSFWTTGRPTVPVCLHSTMIARRVPSTTSSKDIATLVSRAVGLADVLVAEVTEHVLDHILELEPREIVQYSHSELCGQYVATVKYVAERSLVLFLNPERVRG